MGHEKAMKNNQKKIYTNADHDNWPRESSIRTRLSNS